MRTANVFGGHLRAPPVHLSRDTERRRETSRPLRKRWHIVRLAAISCYHASVAQLLVRQLDDDIKAKLQRRARRHGRSTEEEVREILRNAVKEDGSARAPLGTRIAARFARVGLTQEIPELRGQPPHPADFES